MEDFLQHTAVRMKTATVYAVQLGRSYYKRGSTGDETELDDNHTVVSAVDGDYNHVYDDNEDKDGEDDDNDANAQNKGSAMTLKIYHHYSHAGILYNIVNVETRNV